MPIISNFPADSGSTALDTSYDDSDSSINASNVQVAIDSILNDALPNAFSAGQGIAMVLQGPGKSKIIKIEDTLFQAINAVTASGAGAHNSIYRGKYLGNKVTEAQWAAIKAGTFDDLYIGDYWVINGVTYRIAAFDYYYNTGDTACTTHHVVVTTDNTMYTHNMNDTNTTDGGYAESKMRTEGLTQAKATIMSAFGAAHILTHRSVLCNGVANGTPVGASWYDSTVELMTEQNCCGCKVFSAVGGFSNIKWNTIDNSQFPLFAFRHDMIRSDRWFWLRDTVDDARFTVIGSECTNDRLESSYVGGVRPAFSIC